ncbi:putative copper chaperone [Hollandina sp. SP2]
MEEYAMTTSLKIEGMSCEHCVKHVKEALEAIDGVTSANVKLKEKSAVVEHGDAVGLETLKAAVVEAGYEVA